MARQSSSSSMGPIRVLFSRGTLCTHLDSELLDLFLTSEQETSEAAFSTLVGRHGPMVHRLCLYGLRNQHDADDAFQAVFLILARKAHAIRNPQSLGSWLHGVSMRVIGHVLATHKRRTVHETNYAKLMVAFSENENPGRSDEELLLHNEIANLAEKFRAPLILCCLEGMKQEDAARRLGWPIGTLRSRLARGRKRLRARLERRGLGVSLGLFASGAPGLNQGSTINAQIVEACAHVAMYESSKRFRTVGVASASVSALVASLERTILMTKIKLALGAFLPTVLTAGLLVGAGMARTQDPSDAAVGKSAETPAAKQSIGPGSAAPAFRDLQEVERQIQQLRASVAQEEARLRQLQSQLKNAENDVMTANTQRSLITDSQKSAGKPRVPNTGGAATTKTKAVPEHNLPLEKVLPPAHEAPPLDEETAT